VPQRAQHGEVLAGGAEALEEPAEGGLGADAPDGQQRRQQQVAPQISHLRQFLGAGQNADHKAQGHVGGWQRVGTGGPVRQPAGQLPAQAMPVEKAGEGGQPGVAGNLLVGEPDLNGLRGRGEFNELGH